jgi:hypothetical protein
MAADFRIQGAEQFTRMARDLKSADVPPEIGRALDRAGDPLERAVKANARAVLPQRGGLAAEVAAVDITTTVTTGQASRLRVTADARGKRLNLARIDAGMVRRQPVTPGWFTKPIEQSLRKVRQELVTAVETVTRNISNHH